MKRLIFGVVVAMAVATVAIAAPGAMADPGPDASCRPGEPCEAKVQAAAAGMAKQPKRLWATSYLWCDAPKLEVDRWLTEKPETKGKFVLIEFWRTWCGACKRMTPRLNAFHETFGDDLVVIGITGQPEDKVKAYTGPAKKYFLALDKPKDRAGANEEPGRGGEAGGETGPDVDELGQPDADQGVYEAKFGVWGWPHVVILEPEYGAVIWEGFPGQKDYELTEATIRRILAVAAGTEANAKGQEEQ